MGRQVGGVQTKTLPPVDLKDVRVLVVDDNATNREILTTHLASKGMRPSETQAGPEALQALHQAVDTKDPFQIAIIDMQMPGMDGESLGKIIKADGRLSLTQMIMLTSLGTRYDEQYFKGIGFAAYATKPIRYQELLDTLSLVLTERGAVESTPLPATTQETAQATLRSFEGSKTRILLAEDNITNQQVALGMLKKLGLRANAVANGEEALQALEAIPYDLVIMDIQMPEMDGLEATRRIRNPKSAVLNHNIPIIAMTADAMQGDREKCLEAGMNGYVSKPVIQRELLAELKRLLPQENV